MSYISIMAVNRIEKENQEKETPNQYGLTEWGLRIVSAITPSIPSEYLARYFRQGTQSCTELPAVPEKAKENE